MVNLSPQFQMLGEINAFREDLSFGEGALWWPYLSYYWSYLFHELCILWYIYTSQAWLLNLCYRFWMLEENKVFVQVKVFGADALGWLYFSYYWFYLDWTWLDDAFERLGCWIWAVGFNFNFQSLIQTRISIKCL